MFLKAFGWSLAITVIALVLSLRRVHPRRHRTPLRGAGLRGGSASSATCWWAGWGNLFEEAGEDIFIIMLGLGVGAFWIRSITVYLVR